MHLGRGENQCRVGCKADIIRTTIQDSTIFPYMQDLCFLNSEVRYVCRIGCKKLGGNVAANTTFPYLCLILNSVNLS